MVVKESFMKSLCCFILFMLISLGYSQAPSEMDIKLNMNWGEDKLFVDSIYTNSCGEEFKLEKLKFYLSVPLVASSKEVDSPAQAAQHSFLIDLEKSNSQKLNLPPEFTEVASKEKVLRLLIGVDSLVEDAGVFEGDLDPIHSMYWTWNSGHIYFKLEGSSPASSSPGNIVEYHLGGFRGKQKTTQNLKFDISKYDQGESVVINLDLKNLWSNESDVFCISKYSALTLQNQIQPLKARLPHLFEMNEDSL